MRRIKQILLVLLCAFSLTGASLPTTKPEDAGLSSERLQRIHAMVHRHMDLGDITGAVMLVARKGQVAYVDVQGTMDVETKKPMTRDSLFRMASMTKPVIGTAMMMMLEEGKVSAGRSGLQIYPRIQGHEGRRAPDAGGRGAGAAPPKFYTVPADRELTVKELLTHTSGLVRRPHGAERSAPSSTQARTETLADFIPRLASDAARISARRALDVQRLRRFRPARPDRRDRLRHAAQRLPESSASSIRSTCPTPATIRPTRRCPAWSPLIRNDRQGLVKTPLAHSLSMSSKVYFAGGGGLISTVDDYSHFAQMLANGGELYGQAPAEPAHREAHERPCIFRQLFPGARPAKASA